MASEPEVNYGHITKEPGVRGGKACIAGTRLAVLDIALLHESGLAVDEMLNHYIRPLTRGQVHAALAYYYDHREEIQGHIDDARRIAAEVEADRDAFLSRTRGSDAPDREPGAS